MVNRIFTYIIIYKSICICFIFLFIGFASFQASNKKVKYGISVILRILMKSLILGLAISIISFIFALSSSYTLSFISVLIRDFSLAAIISIIIINYAKRKNRIETLIVFGPIILIIWLGYYFLTKSIELTIHNNWVVKGLQNFQIWLNLLPNNFFLLPYIIVFFTSIIIFLLIYINLSRFTKIIRDFIKEKLTAKYQNKIVELIYYFEETEDENGIMDFYNKNAKRYQFARNIFFDELFLLYKTTQGKINEHIRRTFQKIGIKKDVTYYLHHRKWSRKVHGLRLIAKLGYTNEKEYIKQLIFSKNKNLRMEAQLTLAHISNAQNPLFFLAEINNPISKWEQINLLDFYKKERKSIGNITNLFQSKNESVVEFAIFCVGIFQDFTYFENVSKLVCHENTKIKVAAINALALFQEKESSSVIMKAYTTELPLQAKIEIINALGKIGNWDSIGFLKELFAAQESKEIKIAILKSTNLIQPCVIEEFKAKCNPEIDELIKHIKDKRI